MFYLLISFPMCSPWNVYTAVAFDCSCLNNRNLIGIDSLFFFPLKPQVPKVVEKVFFTTALPVAGNTGKLDTELAFLSFLL